MQSPQLPPNGFIRSWQPKYQFMNFPLQASRKQRDSAIFNFNLGAFCAALSLQVHKNECLNSHSCFIAVNKNNKFNFLHTSTFSAWEPRMWAKIQFPVAKPSPYRCRCLVWDTLLLSEKDKIALIYNSTVMTLFMWMGSSQDGSIEAANLFSSTNMNLYLISKINNAELRNERSSWSSKQYEKIRYCEISYVFLKAAFLIRKNEFWYWLLAFNFNNLPRDHGFCFLCKFVFSFLLLLLILHTTCTSGTVSGKRKRLMTCTRNCIHSI